MRFDLSGRTGRRWALAAILLVPVAGCADANAAASRHLADTVRVKDFRNASTYRKAQTTTLYFIGPADADLTQAVTAAGWSPEPAPDPLNASPYEWILTGAADVDDHSCDVTVRRLRPGHERLAQSLKATEAQDLSAGKLTYVEVSAVC